PMVEGGDDEQRDEPDGYAQHDQLLGPAPLRRRAPTQAALQQRAVAREQLTREKGRHAPKDHQIRPRLPVARAARDTEQDQARPPHGTLWRDPRPGRQGHAGGSLPGRAATSRAISRAATPSTTPGSR